MSNGSSSGGSSSGGGGRGASGSKPSVKKWASQQKAKGDADFKAGKTPF